MSKLDQFLISESFYEVLPRVTGVVLEKGISNHRHILLKELEIDLVKYVIRECAASKRFDSNKHKQYHQTRLSSIDAKVDQGCASKEDVINRRDSRKIMGDIDHLEAKDIAQKTKIKWAFEGDENTSFFYGTLKKKQRQLAIKGILKK
ncbi:hypothetical protein Tco_0905642 [Tanacetum coccineum]